MTALQDTIRFLLVDIWPITVVVVLGCAAVYLLLPRPQGPRFWIGLGIGLCALVAAGLFLAPPGEAPPAAITEVVLFYLFSVIAIVSATLLVTQRNPARAALSFALVVLATCGLFLLQAAPFLAAATTIVYAGAIVVTFLFVLMLAQQEGLSDADYRSREPFLASVAGFVLLGTLLYVLGTDYGTVELDEMLARAHGLRERVVTLRERAGEQAEVVPVLKEARRLVQTARTDDAADHGGDIERLRADLLTWAEKMLRGSDASTQFGSAVNVLEKAIVPVSALGFKAETPGSDIRPAEVQKALGGLEEALAVVAGAGEEVRNTLGFLQPPGDRPLSAFSGPPASTELAKLRRDALGRPHLPAENVAYLGRSLFTDYLLAVELAGTLLLVATIGAIAVAHARQRSASETRP